MDSIVTKAEPRSADWHGPPATFDQFVIDRVLGTGGMGHVYLARDLILDRLVALKFISAANPSAAARGRFLVEARAIAKLSHPNVVSVYRVGEVQDRPYIAYEFVAGQTLDRLVKPLPWETTLRLAVGLAAGLEAAHREGILHRDIKPSNVVLSERGEVKLLDFGLAKLARAADEADGAEAAEAEAVTQRAHGLPRTRLSSEGTTAERDLTRPGTMMGTPAYMAPELWWGDAADPRSDVWALGLVLYELLVGKLPHSDLAGEDMARAIVDRDAPPIRSVRSDVPVSFAEIIERCLRREPDERFATVDELLQALHEVRNVFLPLSGALGAVQIEPERLAVSQSLARMSPRMADLTAMLYDRLFAAHPSVRTLFPEDLGMLRNKLAHALKLAIDGLVDPERLAPILEDLGRRHVRYGVFVEHFDALQVALLDTLAQVDAADWSPTLERGWKRAYAFIEGAMRRGMTVEQNTDQSVPVLARRLTRETSSLPKTRYATSGDLSIAYQVVGNGPDLVVMLGWLSHVELVWQHPALATFLKRLSTFARVILFDKRGTGMSDRALESQSEQDRLVDLAAVLDAVGSTRATLFGIAEGAATACAFAAAHETRVAGLVLYAASAHSFPTHDAPYTHLPAALDQAIGRIRSDWGDAVFVERDAPTLVADKSFCSWLALFQRMASSPGTAIGMLKLDAALDLGAVAAALHVPTLVLHRTGDLAIPLGAGRSLAARIEGARFVELPGVDHLPYVGDTKPLLAEIETFVTV